MYVNAPDGLDLLCLLNSNKTVGVRYDNSFVFSVLFLQFQKKVKCKLITVFAAICQLHCTSEMLGVLAHCLF